MALWPPWICSARKVIHPPSEIVKGSKGLESNLDIDRRIFGCFGKNIHQDKYKTIDDTMSDSNIGGRRRRNMRDNLFVIYATIDDAVRKKKFH